MFADGYKSYGADNKLTNAQANLKSLCNSRLHKMLILLYKSLFLTNFPNMLTLRSVNYSLRGT